MIRIARATLVLFFFVSTALAGRAETVTVRQTERSASNDVDASDSDAGLVSFAAIGVQDSSQSSGGGKQQASSLFLVIYKALRGPDDACGRPTRTVLVDIFGNVELPPDAFQIDSKLNQATLLATVEAHDYVSEQPILLDVEATWIADGPASPERFHFVLSEPGHKITWTGKGKSRPAASVVHVKDSSEAELFPQVEGSARMASAQTNTLEITR